MSEFTIDKGIPMPTRIDRLNSGLSATLRAMEIGDSFIFPQNAVRSFYPLMSRIAKNGNKKFTAAKQTCGNYRCWRVE